MSQLCQRFLSVAITLLKPSQSFMSAKFCNNLSTPPNDYKPFCIHFPVSLTSWSSKSPTPITSLPCSETFHDSLLSGKWSTEYCHLLSHLQLWWKSFDYLFLLSGQLSKYTTVGLVHFVGYTCSLVSMACTSLSHYPLFCESTVLPPKALWSSLQQPGAGGSLSSERDVWKY